MTNRAAEPGTVVFLGTSTFAVPSLEALVRAGESVELVVTQPDRPRGRGRRLEASPVKVAAERIGLPVFQPERLSDPAAVQRLTELAPEFLVVVSYGQLLRRAVLDLPRRGVINLHPSLLPRHRGPSPVAWTILSGDERAGVSTMLLDEGMDTGPVLLQQSVPLAPASTRGDLEDRFAVSGAHLLVQTLQGLRSGGLRPKPQVEQEATLSRLLTREMRPPRWERSAAEVRRQIHALSPHPAAVGRAGGRLYKLLRVAEVAGVGEPGAVLRVDEGGPVVACGSGALLLCELQPEGKRAMTGADLARGGALPPGTRFEAPWDDAVEG